LVVGWVNWQPFSFRNEQQQLRGLDVELLDAIFQRAGYQARFSEMPWARVLQRVGERLAPHNHGFTRAWLWNRPDGLDTYDEGVWLWEAGRGISRFD